MDGAKDGLALVGELSQESNEIPCTRWELSKNGHSTLPQILTFERRVLK